MIDGVLIDQGAVQRGEARNVRRVPLANGPCWSGRGPDADRRAVRRAGAARRRGRRVDAEVLFQEPEEQSVLGYRRTIEVGALVLGEGRKSGVAMKTQ